MSEGILIFKAIHNHQEKQLLLQKFLSQQGVLTLKDKFERSLELKVRSVNSQGDLKCHPPEETTMNLKESGTFLVTFSIDEERYLFEATPVVTDKFVSLPVSQLFHLQRRRDFRYTLPVNYSANFVINYLNHNICAHSCRLLDLSTEGCGIEIAIEEADLKLEDLIQGEIFLGDREPIIVQGVIKNIRERGVSHIVLGIEFNHLANPSAHKIITSLTDLQREIYLRKAG